MIKAFAIAIIVLYSGMVPKAHAERDHYMPDINSHWCPGGSGNDRTWGNKWCAGVDFPGGVFWQQAYWPGGKVTLTCRSHETDSLGTPKFAEGCGQAA